MGPASVPRVSAAHAHEHSPELALLSALAHGEEDSELLGVAVASFAHVGDARARAYFDLLRYHLGEALDRALEAIMATSEHKYLSDFARKYYDDGVTIGEARGQARQARVAILTVLRARKLTPSPEDLARIEACADIATLDRWHERAVHAATIADVLND